MYTEKILVLSGIFQKNMTIKHITQYFIPCRRIFSAKHDQCDVRAAHDGKVEV